MIDVIKIEITKTPMCVERETVYFATYDGKRRFIDVLYDKSPTLLDVKKETWKAHRVIDRNGKEFKYLLNVDDREIFDHLMSVTNSSFESAVRKATIEHLENSKMDAIRKIKSLSWWRRLFNKF